ncbi:hypothetical protein DICVIV_09762 [Dictyocaulus viviparus]|uniref:Receptor ligand binding region domain-containing protein n=1 Tax=Dictyocaulus viviparus TaxID=29172 RepID=A0A0D8XHZ1_DICVI|nr:hypothetical protein DICVIV_09762 [Dictyocaulus viviparus]
MVDVRRCLQSAALCLLTLPIRLTLQYPSKVIIRKNFYLISSLLESFTTLSEEVNVAVRALQYAADEINTDIEAPFRLSYDHYDVDAGSSEGWSIVNAVCEELKKGGMLLISIDSGRGSEALRGLSDTLEIPLISLTAPTYPQEPPNLAACRSDHSQAVERSHNVDGRRTLRVFSFLILFYQTGISLPWLWHHLHEKSNSSITTQLLELPRDSDKFTDFLLAFNIRRSNHTNRILIDTTSPSRQQKFLTAVRRAQFSQANFHYVVANFDFLTYDIELFQHGNINITGFQLINKESPVYWNLKRHLKKLDDNFINNYDDVDTRGALAYDAMLVAWKGFARCLAYNDSLFHGTFRHGRFFNRGYPGIYCDPQADRIHPARPFASFEHGRTVTKALRTLTVNSKDGTLTGNIEFDRFGHRKNYEVAVIDLVSNTKATFNSKEVLAWRQGTGFFTNRTVAQHTRKTVENRNKNIVRVVTVWSLTASAHQSSFYVSGVRPNQSLIAFG